MKSHRAIRTKYLPPTNHKGSRIKAALVEDLREGEKAITATISYPYEKNGYERHEPAALAILDKCSKRWGGAWSTATLAGVAYLGGGEYIFSVSI